MGCNPHSKIRSGLDLWLAPRLPAAALRAPARPPGTETAATGRRCRPARPRPAPPGGAAAVRTPCPPRPSRDAAARTPEAPAVPTGPSYSYLTGNPAGTCTAARKCNCFLGKLAQRSPEGPRRPFSSPPSDAAPHPPGARVAGSRPGAPVGPCRSHRAVSSHGGRCGTHGRTLTSTLLPL